MGPLTSICRWSGLFPCNSNFKMSKFLIYYSLTFVGLLVTSTMTLRIEVAVLAKFELTTVLAFVRSSLDCLCILSHIWSIHSTPGLQSILNIVKPVVNSTSRQHLFYPRKWTYLGLWGVALLNAPFIVQDVLDQNWLEIREDVGVFLTDSSATLITLQCAAWVELLGRDMTKQMTRARADVFKAIRRQANIVTNIRVVNKVYSVQLLIYSSRCFFHFITSMFIFMKYYADESIHFLTLKILEAFWQIFWLFLVVSAIEDFNEKVEEFHLELYHIFNESNKLYTNKMLQLRLKMKTTTQFTACGFFSLDFPLVTSIISSATTYLVILVQFAIPTSK